MSYTDTETGAVQFTDLMDVKEWRDLGHIKTYAFDITDTDIKKLNEQLRKDPDVEGDIIDEWLERMVGL